MNIIIKDSPAQVDLAAAQFVAQTVQKNPSAVLGLPTGQTPVGMYANLVRMHRDQNLTFAGVRTCNLDEYVGLGQGDAPSYWTFMHENLFDHIDIASENAFIPNGVSKDLFGECIGYEKHISELGGIDLMVLGMGSNGHIGFNEPGSLDTTRTHVVDLQSSTIADNSVHFASPESMPRQAITMGIATILESRAIMLVVKGAHKAKTVKEALKGPVTADVPASYLQNHPDVTVVLDSGAASLL